MFEPVCETFTCPDKNLLMWIVLDTDLKMRSYTNLLFIIFITFIIYLKIKAFIIHSPCLFDCVKLGTYFDNHNSFYFIQWIFIMNHWNFLQSTVLNNRYIYFSVNLPKMNPWNSTSIALFFLMDHICWKNIPKYWKLTMKILQN